MPKNLRRFAGRNPKISHVEDAMHTADDSDRETEQDAPRIAAPRQMSRKQQRKVDRKMKKAKKNAWYTHQTADEPVPKKQQRNPDKQPERKAVKRKAPDDADDVVEKRKAQAKQRKHEQMVEKLKEDNEKEDKLLKQLEKKLGLKKRKSKALPTSFADEGLDYLLEVLENPKSEMELEAPEGDDSEAEFPHDQLLGNDDDDEDEAPLEIPSNKASTQNPKGILKKPKSLHPVAETILENFEDSDSADIFSNADEGDKHDDDEDEEFDDDGDGDLDGADEEFDEDGGEYSSDNDKTAEGAVENSDEKDGDGTWEDIYGRFRDKQGNVITEKAVGKYIPPGLKAAASGDDGKMERLTKQLKGLLNRLTEANMANIVAQVETLFTTYSRHEMNSTLVKLVLSSCVQSSLMPKRLGLEYGMFLGLLYQNVGQETGAFFVEQLLCAYDELVAANAHQSVDEFDKRLDNVVVLWCHLFNFKIVHSAMIFDLLEEFTARFEEKDIDMILIILREVGFSLRKADPAALKDSLATIQLKANEMLNQKRTAGSRLTFMLDILTAIRNNNMRKIPNYDPSELEHLSKVYRALLRKGQAVEAELKISLNDLRSAKDRGKWWVVGAAWQQPELAPMEKRTVGSDPVSLAVGTASARLLELASKQRMNTDVRKAIFCAIMGAEDFSDAFERIVKLNLKSAQEAEVIHVLIHCILNEKHFNPYYAFVMDKFCGSHRTFQRQLLFALWDKIRDLATLNPSQQKNLAQLLAHGLTQRTLPITVLKKTNFADMNAALVELLRTVLATLLLSPSEKDMTDIFSTLAEKKYKVMRESLRLFMRHFMVRNARKILVDKLAKFSKEDLMKRIDLAEKALLGTNKL
ncbi:nucleolar MIF4G domain-containing protein 1-like [Paramacrobiotus metropolitanus]|uniref:nucleolar MIF4G domain-containing protein 1-like n=1 Tax=Paramacrobiotus metropolitanus TaxID=2943436 RepID=UPI0024456DE6|nr:nucleolar MIF4G domain-containing protein 1-like [Paramacrobiotus metropolitanus]